MSIALALLIGVLTLGVATATADDGGRLVRAIDDCDPRDPNWLPIGCRRARGDVTNAEFGEQLRSPRSVAVVGHPSWRFDPSFLAIGPKRNVRVRNAGGRPHTFTKVADFGGGRIPPLDSGLNFGLKTAPECLLDPGAVDPTQLRPGESLRVTGLAVGNHRFQCCIHPWMRAVIKVKSKN
ncbi:MAG: cupredoxin domain-containing protein [Armatimonadota bacterium]